MTHQPAYTVQVVIDCAAPVELAAWWAEVLRWRVEAHSDDESAAVNHPENGTQAPRILFMRVPETKTVKNRVHLDLRPGVEPSTDELDRLIGLGGRVVAHGSEGPGASWVVMTDLEGNEFCLPAPQRLG